MLEHRGPVWRHAPAALGTALLVTAAVVGTQFALADSGKPRAALSPYREGGFTVGVAAVARRVSITSADDGSYVLGYTPAGGDVVLDLDLLAGETAQPWWYEPRSGRTLKMKPLTSEGVARFPIPKQGGDKAWVLVVDDRSAGYGAPTAEVVRQALGNDEGSGSGSSDDANETPSSDSNQSTSDNASQDQGSTDQGNGSQDQGSQDQGSQDQGSQDQGSQDQGSQDQGNSSQGNGGQDQGNSGQDQGNSGQDQGNSGQDQGNSSQDQGNSSQDQGNSGQDQGKSGQDQGKSGQDQGNGGQDQSNSGQDQGNGSQGKNSQGQQGQNSQGSGSQDQASKDKGSNGTGSGSSDTKPGNDPASGTSPEDGRFGSGGDGSDTGDEKDKGSGNDQTLNPSVQPKIAPSPTGQPKDQPKDQPTEKPKEQPKAAPSDGSWDKLAGCESSGNWAINSGNGYYGGLQFDSATWKDFGGTKYAPRADQASKGEQIEIASKVRDARGGYSSWPACSSKLGLPK